MVVVDSTFSLVTLQGYDCAKLKSPNWAHNHAISPVYRNSVFMIYSDNKPGAPLLSHRVNYRISQRISVSEHCYENTIYRNSFPSSFSGWKGFYFSKHRPAHWEGLRTRVAYDVAGAIEVINDLGLDTLTFLAVTVLIVPTFKLMRASPVRISWSYI